MRRFIANLSGKTRIFAPLVKLKKEEDFVWTNDHQKAFDVIKQCLTNTPVMTSPRPGKPVKLYIAASQATIGSMLAQDDENGSEQVIYYLSRVLTDVESRYSPLEKLCLSLYFACTKLKSYLVSKEVHVISKSDVIKYMLSYPILHGRIGKWMLALTEFTIKYIPAKAVKGQILADFLVDHPCDESDELIVNYVGITPWKLYFDGSKHCRGAGVGIMLISPEQVPTKFMFELKFPCSNNEVEYEALIIGLDLLLAKGVKNVEVIGDSQLVIKQLSREFRCISENLFKYFATAARLLYEFDTVILRHVPRDLNSEANELAQVASRYKLRPSTLDSFVTIRQNLVPFDEREAFVINSLDNGD